MPIRSSAALCATAALVASPFLALNAPLTSSAATTPMSTVRASTLNCTSPVASPFAQTQGSASDPVCAGNTWIYDLPASGTPEALRRTETHWGTSSGSTKYVEGQTITHEAVYTGQLGAAAQADNDWHVIWQMHGPFKDNSWRPPAMGLTVRNGTLRLSGGSGHPQHDWNTRNYEWIAPLTTWTDGKPVRVKVQSYLSSDPSKGWVSAWVDGRQVLNQWRPTSYKGGLRPGTFYPGQDHLVSRNGLYRGTQAGPPPTYRQVMGIEVVRAG